MAVYLVIDDETLDYQVLSDDNDYAATFENLPDPDSVDSIRVMEGTIASDGTVSPVEPIDTWKIAYGDLARNEESRTMTATVTNSLLPQPETTRVSVTKQWAGAAGESATFHLLANGADTGQTLTVTADDDWTGTFADLAAEDADGKAIDYTITEDAVEGYESSISGDAATGFTVTNTQVQPTPEGEDTGTAQSTETPDTGDGTPFGLLALLAGLGMTSVVAAGRLRQHE